MTNVSETIMDLGAPCLASETWETDYPALVSAQQPLVSAQQLCAPSIRRLPGEWVGDHDPKPSLFPWCNE
jgi:hypothetical protein